MDNLFGTYKLEDVLNVVSETMSVTKEAILGTKRDRLLVDARRIVMMIILTEESVSVSEAARAINKNHATVIHYRRTHEALYASMPRYRNTYDICLKKYKGEKHLTFQDFLDRGAENSKLQEDLRGLQSENAELRYSILKLEKKLSLDKYGLSWN